MSVESLLTVQLNSFSLALFVVSLIAGILILVSWSRRRAPGATLTAWMMLALLFWSGGYGIELASLDQAAMLFWVRIEYLGITTLPVLWLLFVLRYTRSENRLARSHPMLFFLVPVCILVIHYTNAWHNQFYTSTYVNYSDPFPNLVVVKGPWYWVNACYGYLCILTGSWLLLRYGISSPHLYRRRAWTIVIAALTPLTGNILYQLGLTPRAGLDLTPFAFLATGLIVVWGLYRLRLFDVTPLARDRLIEKLRDGMLVLDEQGRIVDLNPAARQFLALDNAVVGKEVQAVDSAWPGLAEFCSSRAQSRTEVVLEQNRARYLEAECLPLSDRGGRFVGSVLILHDITEQRESEAAEKARQVAEAAYHAIQQVVDTVQEGLVLLDECQRVTMVNRAGQAHLVLLAGVGVGESITTLGGHSLQEMVQPQAGLPHYTLTIEHAVRYTFELAVHPLQQEKLLGSWLLVTRDVTQNRQIQQEMEKQERLAAVGQLAAGIAHDFNNVLAVFTLYTGLLQRSPDLSPKQKRYLEVLTQQADSASQLVQQVLDFSRKAIVQRSVIDLAPFLTDLVELCRRTLPETIAVDFSCEPGQYPVLADTSRLQQALMNLAVNARDAMPDGGTLHFHLSRQSFTEEQSRPLADLEPGEWMVIQVSDSGTGIESGVQLHIFEPFFTTKQPSKGTGLGLAQVFGIVKQHGGEIGVESHLGHGSTFTLYLPPTQIEEAPAAGSSVLPPPSGGRETILVVEDQTAVREAIRDLLSDLNYRVLVAENGQEAKEIFEQNGEEIDLVVSDMVMPKMNGIELYQALKVKNPSLKMILSTGYPLGEEGSDLLEQENLSWLQKPYSGEFLSQKIRAILEPSSNP